jgi:hypothetical protein
MWEGERERERERERETTETNREIQQCQVLEREKKPTKYRR